VPGTELLEQLNTRKYSSLSPDEYCFRLHGLELMERIGLPKPSACAAAYTELQAVKRLFRQKWVAEQGRMEAAAYRHPSKSGEG
jgi:hypothetical protein